MLTYSPGLGALLAGATTKQDWSNKINTALGNARRLRCFRDANAAATDPFSTGTEFLNIGSSGALTITSGNITGFGTLFGATIQQAVTLSTGAAVLRIEGGGEWIQGTLGLPGSGKDFIMTANLAANVGVGFARDAQVKAPRFLASGTGPAAPGIKPTTPTVIELVDWSDPNNPVVVGSATFNTRTDDWVFEDAEMAAEIGDVAVYQLSGTIKWNSAPATQRFELGAVMFLSNQYNSMSGGTQVEQIVCSFKPLGRWTSYPAMDTYTKAVWTQTGTDGSGNPIYACSNASSADSTYPPPFKINLKAADGSIVYTHEMKAFNGYPALPINSPQLSQALTDTAPLVPHFHCGMMLPWQNVRTRLSSKAGKYFPGVSAASYGPKVAKAGPTVNGLIPLIDGHNQINALNHMYGLPPYPMRRDTDYGDIAADVEAYDPGPFDPNGFVKTTYHNYEGKLVRAVGWKYQPGSISGHDWYTGPGGARFDRSPSPSVLAVYASNQAWLRPDSNAPIRDMWDGFSMAYFNQGCHWVGNAQTMLPATDPDNWGYANAYYGAGPFGSNGTRNSIDMCGIPASGSRQAQHNDASGRLVWQGWLRDGLHSTCHPAWSAVMINSVMHAYAQQFHYNAHWMSELGSISPTSEPADPTLGGGGFFLVRVQAWRWLAYTMQWKVCSQHSMGKSRASVEARFQAELEKLYDSVYVPAFVNNDQRPYFISLRNLGIAPANGSILTNGVTFQVFQSVGGSLALYMAHTLALMKQFGLWSVMKAKNAKCQAALEMMLMVLDKQTVDYILQTDGRDCYYQLLTLKQQSTPYNWTAADVPANWAAAKANLDAALPVISSSISYTDAGIYNASQRYINWGTDYKSVPGDQCSTQHLQYQYVKMRKLYFPEYANANLDTAIAKYETYYTAAANYATAANDPAVLEWAYRMPSHGDLLAPSVVGPN